MKLRRLSMLALATTLLVPLTACAPENPPAKVSDQKPNATQSAASKPVVKPAGTPTTAAVAPASISPGVKVPAGWKVNELGPTAAIAFPSSYELIESDPEGGEAAGFQGAFTDLSDTDGAPADVHVSVTAKSGTLQDRAKALSKQAKTVDGLTVVDQGFLPWPKAEGAWFAHKRLDSHRELADDTSPLNPPTFATTFIVDTKTKRIEINFEDGPYAKDQKRCAVDQILSTLTVR